MKNKPIITILIILFVACFSVTVYGYYLNRKGYSQKPVEVPKQIAYEYYVEGQLVESLPQRDDGEGHIYEFSKSECDNNMTLEFNPETWEYTITNEADGTCKLYFVKSEYTVTITATNGLINGEEASYSFTVSRLTDGTFNIVPNEGYEYKTVTCANEKEAIFDISTNVLTINSISEDMACKIDFAKRNLKADIVVKNGTGTTTEYKDYGESLTVIVQPNEGYEKAKIECSNKQEATYKDNNLTIAKLTENTKCTVTFSKKPAVTYNLIINDLPEQVTITSGNKKQTIVSGKDGKFSLKAQDGYQIVLDCDGVKPSDEQQDPDGVITYTFLGVSKNITCNVTAKEEETQIDTNEGN